MKVKNVRAGIVIIADAGIKLAPGETIEVENPTRQVQTAITGGILARVDAGSDTRPKTKAAARTAESKEEAKKPAKPGEVAVTSDNAGDSVQTATGDAKSPELPLKMAGAKSGSQ